MVGGITDAAGLYEPWSIIVVGGLTDVTKRVPTALYVVYLLNVSRGILTFKFCPAFSYV